MRIITLALAVCALAVAAPAIADRGGVPNGGNNGGENGNKGGNGNSGGGGNHSSSLALVVLDPDDGGANHGEQVTFEVSTTATDKPYVSVSCYQDGTLVYSASAGFYEGYAWPWTQVFTLSSNAWSGGAADCRASLDYWDGRGMRSLASLSFTAYA